MRSSLAATSWGRKTHAKTRSAQAKRLAQLATLSSIGFVTSFSQLAHKLSARPCSQSRCLRVALQPCTVMRSALSQPEGAWLSVVNASTPLAIQASKES